MKILHVTPILGPANGGSAVIPLSLAKEQAKLGNDVTIITSNYQLDKMDFNLTKAVHIERFDCSRLLKSSYYTPRMRDWLISNCAKFDIIHLHNFRSYQSIIVQKYAKKFGTPYLIQAHGSAKNIGGKDILKRIFDTFWGRRIIEDASAYIAVSRREIDHYAELGAPLPLIRVIPNALATGHPLHLQKKGEFRVEHGIAAEAEIILFVGRLNKIKAIDVLIRAFAHLQKERKSAVLVIIGPDDGAEKQLRELVKSLGLVNVVKFIGFMNNPIPAYLDADVLAYPSRYEIFGLVPFEAIMAGTPVVVSNDSGCGEMISEMKCGLVVPSNDEVALSDSIIFLLDNPVIGHNLVSNGRRYVLEKMTWDIVSNKIGDLYKDILEQRKRKS